MNCGGLAAVLHSTAVEEESTIISKGMTYSDERYSARWKERRARFLGCIENTKLIAERTKQRQENARIERLKKERAEMEKYRRRYLEAAMKQYMEQQAKPREGPSSVTSSHGRHFPQLLSTSQNHLGCMQVLGTAVSFTPNCPAISACKPNMRKRQIEDNGEWMKYAQVAIVNDQRNVYHAKGPEIFENNKPAMQAADSFRHLMSKQVPHFTSNKSTTKMHQMNYIVPEIERAEQYDQTRMGSSILPTTSQADVTAASTIPEEMSNLSAMPELAELHVKDLMDQIGPSNSLDDLGGNCLEGVLVNHCDEVPCTLDAETEKLKMHSASSSIVSPISATCGTPNSALSPSHRSVSARCSTNSFYDSHSTAVTPQQDALTPPYDHSQRIPITSTLAAPPTVIAQDNSLLCTRNASSCSTSSVDVTNAMPLASLVCNNDNCSSSNVNGSMYDSSVATLASATISSQLHQPRQQQRQQQHYHFAHMQEYRHSRQQQQLLNLFNNGCHVSSNNAQLSHMDNTRVYNEIEYPTLGRSYNPYSSPNKSSIFSSFPSQTFVECSAPPQYDHAMKYPNNGTSYYAQQPEMNVQQQTYQFQVPIFQQPHHQRLYQGCISNSLATATQNTVYPTTNF